MVIIEVVLFSFYWFIVLIIILFNMLYLFKASRAKVSLGLQIPQWIRKLTHASTGLAIFTAIFLGAIFVFHLG